MKPLQRFLAYCLVVGTLVPTFHSQQQRTVYDRTSELFETGSFHQQVYTGIFLLDNVIVHTLQNLMNNFSSLVLWIIVSIFKYSTVEDVNQVDDFSDRQTRSVSGSRINVTRIFEGVFTSNNLWIHFFQNALNYAASLVLWIVIAPFVSD